MLKGGETYGPHWRWGTHRARGAHAMAAAVAMKDCSACLQSKHKEEEVEGEGAVLSNEVSMVDAGRSYRTALRYGSPRTASCTYGTTRSRKKGHTSSKEHENNGTSQAYNLQANGLSSMGAHGAETPTRYGKLLSSPLASLAFKSSSCSMYSS